MHTRLLEEKKNPGGLIAFVDLKEWFHDSNVKSDILTPLFCKPLFFCTVSRPVIVIVSDNSSC